MVARYLRIGLVMVAAALSACGKDGRQQETPPPPSGMVRSNGPKDQPFRTSDWHEIERATAPYVEQARSTYPEAKRRFLAGLPQGYRFSVITKLHSPGHVEQVFVAVTSIQGDRITGMIASVIRGVAGYKAGDTYTFPEAELVDWVIVDPDGKEEGNVVGKFLDTWSH